MRADIYPVTLGYPPIADNIIDENDLNLVMANLGLSGTFCEQTVQAPDFQFIEKEIERSEDVILMLGFWYFDGESWIREEYPYPYGSGHCVTAAGVNSTIMQIAISDPIQDNAEAGGPGRVYPPPPHPHPPSPPDTVHNDASYISHDIYNVTWISPPLPPCPGGNWSLVNYTTPQIPVVGYTTVIEWAVTVSPLGVHDIAVTNVTTSKTGCLPMPTVGQNYTATVNVTIFNEGDFTENVTVTVYANTTAIVTQTILNLAPNTSRTITIVWDTTGFAKGNYVISAYATPVPDETDTTDNTFTDGTIYVGIPGDINGDKIVDIFDAVLLAAAAGSMPGSPNWNPNADINGDRIVDIFDAVILAAHAGQTDP